MADHPVSVIPEGCSRRLRLHRPPSVANIFTRPSRPWPPIANLAFLSALGNKRVGANAAITFLLMNDWEPDFEPDELAELVLSVASGAVDKAAVAALFGLHCRPSDTALAE